MNHFLDIGANVGQTFYQYLIKHPEYNGWKVWCFEPSPRHLPELLTTIKAYESIYNIVVCTFGLSSKSGAYYFGERNDPLADQFAMDGFEDHFLNKGKMICAMINIVWFIKNHNIDTETEQVVIKLDCEGSEYDILKTLITAIQVEALLFCDLKILIEWHPHPTYTHQDKLEIDKQLNHLNIKTELWTL